MAPPVPDIGTWEPIWERQIQDLPDRLGLYWGLCPWGATDPLELFQAFHRDARGDAVRERDDWTEVLTGRGDRPRPSAPLTPGSPDGQHDDQSPRLLLRLARRASSPWTSGFAPSADAYPVRPLGELVEFLDHKLRPVKESDRRPGEYPYYGANGPQGNIHDYIFDEPLILLAEDGWFLDQPDRGIAYRIDSRTWVSNHLHVLRPGKGIEVAYLCRVLENYDVTPFVTGTTRGKLTKAGASEIPLPLPALPEQRRIAEVLDEAEELRAKRRAALAELDTLFASLQHRAFRGEL